MWTEFVEKLGAYPTAVLTGSDSAGYPVSIRCNPQIDQTRQVLKVQIPENLGFTPGPACILCHYHDEKLWNQTNFVARGKLDRDDNGWIFSALRLIDGAGAGMSLMRQIRDGRKHAKQYLVKRGLVRPIVPWASIAELHKRSKKD